MVWLKGFKEFSTDVADGVQQAQNELGNAVIDRVCSIRSKYPNTFRRGGILTPVLDRLCSDNGYAVPPSLPSLPFEGGQMEGVQYNVFTRVEITDGNGNVNFSETSFLAIGKINDIYVDRNQTGSDLRWKLIAIDNAPSSPRTRVLATYGSPPTTARLVEVTVTRVDGQPDTGGNLPPKGYPDDPPIDASDFSATVQICGTPNDTEDQRCVDVAIDFDPFLDENGNQCYTIDGDRYCFTPDGVEKQDEPTECIKEPPPIDELAPTAQEDTNESEEDDPAIAYVTTEITTFPFEGKTIIQADSNDNDYFAGYFNWLTSRPDGSYRHPAIPIRKRLQIFTRPSTATGYKAYTVNGAKLRITVYKEQGENSDGT